MSVYMYMKDFHTGSCLFVFIFYVGFFSDPLKGQIRQYFSYNYQCNKTLTNDLLKLQKRTACLILNVNI